MDWCGRKPTTNAAIIKISQRYFTVNRIENCPAAGQKHLPSDQYNYTRGAAVAKTLVARN